MALLATWRLIQFIIRIKSLWPELFGLAPLLRILMHTTWIENQRCIFLEMEFAEFALLGDSELVGHGHGRVDSEALLDHLVQISKVRLADLLMPQLQRIDNLKLAEALLNLLSDLVARYFTFRQVTEGEECHVAAGVGGSKHSNDEIIGYLFGIVFVDLGF